MEIPHSPDPWSAHHNNAHLLDVYADNQVIGWQLHLPWAQNPLPANRPSGGSHWSRSSGKIREVRDTARLLTARSLPRMDRIRVRLDWMVCSVRTRDVDNLWPLAKALVDGLRDQKIKQGTTSVLHRGIVPDDDERYVIRESPQIVSFEKSPQRPTAYFRLHIWPADAE